MSSLEEHEAGQRALSGEPSNNDRALWAYGAVETMALETGAEDEEIEAKIGDLLCNLRHLCDAEGLDFAAIDKSSHRCYIEELAEQPVADTEYASASVSSEED